MLEQKSLSERETSYERKSSPQPESLAEHKCLTETGVESLIKVPLTEMEPLSQSES